MEQRTDTAGAGALLGRAPPSRERRVPYPVFELGERESAVRYPGQLAPLVEVLIAANPRPTDWTLTAFPYSANLGAANLLCWEISRSPEEVSDRQCN